MIAIAAGQIITPFQTIEHGVILIDAGRIVAVGTEDQVTIPPEAEVIDARLHTVAPGLIDLHTHGGGGVEAIEATPAALDHLASFYASHGVTGFLAGVWGSNTQIEAGIDAVVGALHTDRQPPGAALLGLFLEGPFINPDRRGAFPLETIVPPDRRLLDRYLERANGHLRLLTLAPELPGADELIRAATIQDVVCAAGHSAATWEQMQQAIHLGVRHVTHTFNAMGTLHHREPGLIGAALVDDRVTAEIIADGIHTHPVAARILVRARGVEGVVLITDSIAAAGLPDGAYYTGGINIIVEHDRARLADGTLAGSTLTMERGVANLVTFGAASLAEAIAIGSYNPAGVLGLHKRKGWLAPGYDADLVSLDDVCTVQWTMVKGQIVYARRDT